jgi:hypothetical protein
LKKLIAIVFATLSLTDITTIKQLARDVARWGIKLFKNNKKFASTWLAPGPWQLTKF